MKEEAQFEKIDSVFRTQEFSTPKTIEKKKAKDPCQVLAELEQLRKMDEEFSSVHSVLPSKFKALKCQDEEQPQLKAIKTSHIFTSIYSVIKKQVGENLWCRRRPSFQVSQQPNFSQNEFDLEELKDKEKECKMDSSPVRPSSFQKLLTLAFGKNRFSMWFSESTESEKSNGKKIDVKRKI